MEKHILFVDDEPSILMLLEMLARSLGYVPRCTTSGKIALQIMQRDHIRVFCLDLRMPEMDGLELCRQIKQRDPGACVYALSAYVASYRPELLRGLGFEEVFPKPFEVTLLEKAFAKAFKKIEQQDSQKP
jgi:CheY-like chemotaxis protein